LANASIDDVGVKALSKCDKLEILKLKGADISAEGMKALSNLSQLKELDLDELLNVTPEKLEPLTRMKGLEKLRLLGAELGPVCTPMLCRMTFLDELDLRGTALVKEPAQLKEIERALKNSEVKTSSGPRSFHEYVDI